MARCANGWFATSPKGRHRFCSFRGAFGLHLLPEYGDNTTNCVKNTARHQDILLLAMYYYIYTYINYLYIYILKYTLLSFISSSTHLDCMWQKSAENIPASPWLMHPRHHRYPQWAFGLYLANITLVVTWEDLLGRMGTLDDTLWLWSKPDVVRIQCQNYGHIIKYGSLYHGILILTP